MRDTPLPALLTRRATATATAPRTLDRDRRTVEVVAATAAPVRMPPPSPAGGREPWIEILDMAGADLSRFIGAPLLVDHAPTVAATVGVVDAAEIRGGELTARLRFSSTADADEVFTKVMEGALRGVSVGYRVTRHEPAAEPGTWIARAWQPVELSLVPIPADAAARVRSAVMQPRAPKEAEMPDHTPPAEPAQDAALAERERITRIDHHAAEARERGMAETTVALLRTAALREGWTAEHLKERLAEAEQRGRAFDERAREEQKQPGFQPSPVSRYLGSYDDPTFIRRRRAAAVAAQALGREPPPEAREFMQHRGLVEMARAEFGERDRGAWRWSRDQVVGQMLRAFHVTTDFPSLFTDTMDRQLLMLQAALPQPWRLVCAPRAVPDFRSFKTVSAAGPAQLEQLLEGGEVTYTTIHTRDEVGQLATYARAFAVTRQALVNDDLGALADAARLFASGVAQTYRTLFLTMFATNGGGWGPTMADGNPLFSAAHGNVTAGAATTAGVSALRALLRKQTDASGTVLGLAPKLLLSGPDSETPLAQVLSSVVAPIAVAEAERPVFTDMERVVEAGLSGPAFFAFVDPLLHPVLQLVHLAGQDGARVETFNGGPAVDGVIYRATLDTAIVAAGWVGAARASGT